MHTVSPNITRSKSKKSPHESSDTGYPLEPLQTALTSLLSVKVVWAGKSRETRVRFLEGLLYTRLDSPTPKHSPSPLMPLQRLPSSSLPAAWHGTRQISSFVSFCHISLHMGSAPHPISGPHTPNAVTFRVTAPVTRVTRLEKLPAFWVTISEYLQFLVHSAMTFVCSSKRQRLSP